MSNVKHREIDISELKSLEDFMKRPRAVLRVEIDNLEDFIQRLECDGCKVFAIPAYKSENFCDTLFLTGEDGPLIDATIWLTSRHPDEIDIYKDINTGLRVIRFWWD